jgi:hypothetical protein
MHFNNPAIIKTETDVILGSVKMNGDSISYIALMQRCVEVLEYYIHKDMELLQSDEISYKKALWLTAQKIYSSLDMYENTPPKDIEHLAEIITQSRNYEMWASDIKNRFFQIHAGKVEIDTKVPAFGEGGMSESEIVEVLDETSLDSILEVLKMNMDIGHPSNS